MPKFLPFSSLASLPWFWSSRYVVALFKGTTLCLSYDICSAKRLDGWFLSKQHPHNKVSHRKLHCDAIINVISLHLSVSFNIEGVWCMIPVDLCNWIRFWRSTKRRHWLCQETLTNDCSDGALLNSKESEAINIRYCFWLFHTLTTLMAHCPEYVIYHSCTLHIKNIHMSQFRL